eukprot:2449289-Rhodomonas_salina.1
MTAGQRSSPGTREISASQGKCSSMLSHVVRPLRPLVSVMTTLSGMALNVWVLLRISLCERPPKVTLSWRTSERKAV